jgi:hypothetical protein
MHSSVGRGRFFEDPDGIVTVADPGMCQAWGARTLVGRPRAELWLELPTVTGEHAEGEAVAQRVDGTVAADPVRLRPRPGPCGAGGVRAGAAQPFLPGQLLQVLRGLLGGS